MLDWMKNRRIELINVEQNVIGERDIFKILTIVGEIGADNDERFGRNVIFQKGSNVCDLGIRKRANYNRNNVRARESALYEGQLQFDRMFRFEVLIAAYHDTIARERTDCTDINHDGAKRCTILNKVWHCNTFKGNFMRWPEDDNAINILFISKQIIDGGCHFSRIGVTSMR